MHTVIQQPILTHRFTILYRDEFDLDGMESSWNSSAWVGVDHQSENQDEDSSGDDDTIHITQLDGPIEQKPGTSVFSNVIIMIFAQFFFLFIQCCYIIFFKQN